MTSLVAPVRIAGQPHLTAYHQQLLLSKAPHVVPVTCRSSTATSGAPPARLARQLACMDATCECTQYHSSCIEQKVGVVRRMSGHEPHRTRGSVSASCAPIPRSSVPVKQARKIGNFTGSANWAATRKFRQIKTPKTLIAIVVSPRRADSNLPRADLSPTLLARPRLGLAAEGVPSLSCIGSLLTAK